MPRKTIRGNQIYTGNVEIGGTLDVTGAFTPAITSINDSVLLITNTAAPTKIVRFSASGVSAGQTRVLTAPDFNGTLATLAGTETFTAKTLTSPKVGTAICDTGGNEIIKTPATADAVNELTITNAATLGTVAIAATGGDADIPVSLAGKGTGVVKLGQATSAGITLVADQPICDSSANEYLKFAKAATAINEFTVTNAAAGGSPLLSATGGDTNISVMVDAKGTGQIVAKKRIVQLMSATTNATASDQTFTAAQLLGGLILRDPNGGPRADLLPTAALLVAAIPGCAVGTAFEFSIRNTADAAETITVTAPDAAVTISGTATIAQSNAKKFLVIVTNIGGGTEAYTAYSLGTLVF